MYSASEMKQRILQFVKDWVTNTKSKHGEHFGSSRLESTCKQQAEYVHYISNSNTPFIKVHPATGVKTYKPDRGGKVEVFHSVLGTFANQGTSSELAHAITVCGTGQWSYRQWWRKQLFHNRTNVKEPPHLRPWLSLHIDDALDSLKCDSVFSEGDVPRLKISKAPKLERFCYDYFKDQLAREKDKPGQYENARICPCSECTARRKWCLCPICSMSRNGITGADMLKDYYKHVSTTVNDLAQSEHSDKSDSLLKLRTWLFACINSYREVENTFDFCHIWEGMKSVDYDEELLRNIVEIADASIFIASQPV